MSISVKISQLDDGGSVSSIDQIPVARGSLNTFRIPASQFVVNGSNVGSGSGQIYFDKAGGAGSTLQFRSLSGADGVVITNQNNTLVISASGQNPVKTSITGNGTTTTFAINGANSINANNYRVDIDGVLQEPINDYNIVGSNIVFNPAPPNGSKVTVVSNNLVRAFDIVPSDGSVTTNKVVDRAITSDKIALSGIDTANINNGAVTSDKIASNVITQAKLASNTAGNGPAFRAWASSNTSILPSGVTKIILATEDYDTNNNFTDSRFTPTVAGYYQVSGCVRVDTGATGLISIIRKNGVVHTYGSYLAATSTHQSVVSDIVYLNGTTDYIELFAAHNDSVAKSIGVFQPYTTYFSGALIRAA